MLRAFHVWDYTFPVLPTPGRFAGSELFPGALGRVVRAVLARTPRAVLRRCCRSCPPTCGWRPRRRRPAVGAALPQPPEPVRPL